MSEEDLPEDLRDSTNLYIRNLNPKLDEEHFLKFFARYGPLASYRILWPRNEFESERKSNTAYVAYMTRQDAERAYDKLDGYELGGYDLRINFTVKVPIPDEPVFCLEDLKDEDVSPIKESETHRRGETSRHHQTTPPTSRFSSRGTPPERPVPSVLREVLSPVRTRGVIIKGPILKAAYVTSTRGDMSQTMADVVGGTPHHEQPSSSQECTSSRAGIQPSTSSKRPASPPSYSSPTSKYSLVVPPEHHSRPGTPGSPSSSKNSWPVTPGSQTHHQHSRPGTPESPLSSKNSRPGTPSSQAHHQHSRPGTPESPSSSQKSRPGTPGSPSSSKNSRPGTPGSQIHPQHSRPGTPDGGVASPYSQTESTLSRYSPTSTPVSPISQTGGPFSGRSTPLSRVLTPVSRTITPVSGKSTPLSRVVTPVSGRSTPLSPTGVPVSPESPTLNNTCPRGSPIPSTSTGLTTLPMLSGSNEKLRDSLRIRLARLLKKITLDRELIAEAMRFCIENANCGEDIIRIIVESITEDKPTVPASFKTNLAKLYLISDILFNCEALNASFYHLGFIQNLEEFFVSLREHLAMSNEPHKFSYYRNKIIGVLKVWKSWSVYSNDFLIRLTNIVLDIPVDSRDLDGKPLKEKIFKVCLSEKGLRHEWYESLHLDIAKFRRGKVHI